MPQWCGNRYFRKKPKMLKRPVAPASSSVFYILLIDMIALSLCTFIYMPKHDQSSQSSCVNSLPEPAISMSSRFANAASIYPASEVASSPFRVLVAPCLSGYCVPRTRHASFNLLH
mmetsp:Transcript_10547/g.16016  ORF Transcript_10547/g.16016 Transcript_10547/m.16016 type:complete len:116 (+) Transcript_10547:160-507(+)